MASRGVKKWHAGREDLARNPLRLKANTLVNSMAPFTYYKQIARFERLDVDVFEISRC